MIISKILFGLYDLAIWIIDRVLCLLSVFNGKAKLLKSGRKESWKKLSTLTDVNRDEKLIWFHCASLGEFEQGRPLIENVRKKFPEIKILLSFYSPSGYEIQKNYNIVDFVFYLPSDSRKNALKLYRIIRPDFVFLIKYEFWWNLLDVLQSKGVYIGLISGVFRDNQYFFRKPFEPWRKIIGRFNQIFVQDENSRQILISKGIHNALVVGDSRIDRVLQNASIADQNKNILRFSYQKKTVVYGSIWLSDLAYIKPFIVSNMDVVHILVPHDVKVKNINAIKAQLNTSVSIYSEGNWESNILIVDQIGLLGKLYKLAFAAYVGGGFQAGIHNILEPAVFGIPVFFGPKYEKFIEAVDMINLELAFCIQNTHDFENQVNRFLTESEVNVSLKIRSDSYFKNAKGATEKIMQYLEPELVSATKNKS